MTSRPTITVRLPRVHVAGAHAHSDAHIEVGQHGFALFLAPDAALPMLDIDGTPEQLRDLLASLEAALASLFACDEDGPYDSSTH